MLAIYKYTLEWNATTLQMHKGARILSCQLQHGTPRIWALVDPKQPLVDRYFAQICTGSSLTEDIHNYEFLATAQYDDGNFVQHIFVKREETVEEEKCREKFDAMKEELRKLAEQFKEKEDGR
jgi:hypothetical protein